MTHELFGDDISGQRINNLGLVGENPDSFRRSIAADRDLDPILWPLHRSIDLIDDIGLRQEDLRLDFERRKFSIAGEKGDRACEDQQGRRPE
jgi:hypothetical protein